MLSLLSLVGAVTTAPGTLELALLTGAGAMPLPRPPLDDSGPFRPPRRMAVVVPAHNEALGIGRCLHSLRTALPPRCPLEIVVVADNCTDDTARRAREAGVRVLERSDPTQRGKGFALAYAFETLLEAQSDLDAVLVVDADTDVEANFFRACERYFGAGVDAVQCRYLVRDPDSSERARLMNVAFMAFNVLRPRGRERLGLSVGIFGNGFGLSRRCLEAVPYEARSVVEDLEHHLNLVRKGLRVRFVDETCVRGAIPGEGRGVETQRARWEGGRLRMATDHAPRLAREVARGNLASLEPLLELALLPLATHTALLGAMVLIPFPPTQAVGVAGLGVVAAHVAAAMVVGGATRDDLRALARVPGYIAHKARLLPRILEAAQEHQQWVRTERG